jgi:hypothetical protein
MSIDHLIARITELAASQHGLVRLEQLEPAEHRRMRHLNDRGIIERVATGVYRVSGSPMTWAQSLQAGLWALGRGAVVSHASAARLHRFDRFEDITSLEFTVARGHRERRPANLDVVVHSTTRPLNGDLRHVEGLAVTSPVRTILDLARAGVPNPLLEAAIDSALRLRLTSLGHLIQRVEEVKGPGRHGVARLDDLLVTSGGHSVLERRFLQLVRRCGLPAPKPQVVHRDDGRHVARVDFLFQEQGVVVEVSGGRGHSTPSDRAKDARRRNELQQMGRTVLEFTYEDVTRREAYVVRTLRAAGVSASRRQ